jgi:hypothetical protein
MTVWANWLSFHKPGSAERASSSAMRFSLPGMSKTHQEALDFFFGLFQSGRKFLHGEAPANK